MTLAISPLTKARAQHLLSYLLVSLVPIMICGILLIGNTYSQHTDQEDQAAYNGLHMFSSTYSRLMSSMDSCAGHFEDSYTDYLQQGEASICAQIASYKKNYEAFTDVFYYVRGSDHVYTGEGQLNYHAFELEFMLNYNVDLNMSQLFSNMNHVSTVTALRSRSVLDNTLDGEYTFYLHPVPELDANPVGVMVFVISNDTLQALLNECVPAGYELYVCSNQYLNWLFRSDLNANTTTLFEYMNRMNSMGVFHANIDGSSYLLLRDGSEHDSVYHMLAYDSSKLYDGIIAERNRSLLVLLVAVILAALAAYLLHKFMYSPIEALLRLPLPQADANARHLGMDGLLGNVVSSTKNVLDQNTMLREQARDHCAMLTTQAIIAMMHGSSLQDAGLAGIWNADAQLKEYSNYTIMYAECGSIPENAFYHGEFRKYNGEGYNMFVLPLDAAGQIAVLVNHTDSDRSALAQAALHALNALNISTNCLGVGLSYTWRERIPISLLQAQVAARTARSDMPYCCFAEDNIDTSFTGFLPFYGKMLLCQCIRNGEKDLALSTFLKMRTDIMPLSGNDTIMRSWAFFVFDAISSVMHETGNVDLLSSITLDDMLCMPQSQHFALMENLITNVCEHVAKQREQALSAGENSLINYVNEHFCDQDISLGKLSAEFRFSESYITRIMRERTGMSFLQYVSSKRMELIKLRLRTSDVPIKDIVSEAGYVDIANFTRKFRTSEGITPGTYRELYQTKS